MMSYDRAEGKFSWLIPSSSSCPVTADKEALTKYFSADIAQDIFEVRLMTDKRLDKLTLLFQFAASFAQLEIPGHVLIVLILICVYSRDGMLMKKQVRKIILCKLYFMMQIQGED